MVEVLMRSMGIDEAEEPLCIRFVNTVGERSGPESEEYFKDAEDLRKAFVRFGILREGIALDESYRVRAIELRDGIYRMLSSIAARRTAAEDDIETLNAELAEALAKIELASTGGQGVSWVLTERNPRERALMVIALSAAGVASSPLANRVRECANETCGWIFLDHSKNRSRRWCSMADCGNKAKARRFQARRRSAVST
jgi:predicted RNA-binding Zn ribbon-like protein